MKKIINEIRDQNGNVIKTEYEDENGCLQWTKSTFNQNGRMLIFKNSEGCWSENTYDKNGNILTCKDSDGAWFEKGFGWCIVEENIRKQ